MPLTCGIAYASNKRVPVARLYTFLLGIPASSWYARLWLLSLWRTMDVRFSVPFFRRQKVTSQSMVLSVYLVHKLKEKQPDLAYSFLCSLLRGWQDIHSWRNLVQSAPILLLAPQILHCHSTTSTIMCSSQHYTQSTTRSLPLRESTTSGDHSIWVGQNIL